MRPGTDRTVEHRVSLTRVCLRSGSVVLPLAARASFEGRDSVEAVDLERNETHLLELRPRNRLAGLEGFFEDRGLAVNDVLVLRPMEDGRVALLARGRPRTARRDPGAVRRAVNALLAGAPPRTEEELRFDHDLADDAPLRAALDREPRLERRAGRWGLRPTAAEGTGAAPADRGDVQVAPRPPARPAPHDAALVSAREEDVPLRPVDEVRRRFRDLGYDVVTGRDGLLRLSTPDGRQGGVLLKVLGEGERPDWNALLYALREARAERLALLGDVRDLHPLERPARGARATLWSWDGMERLEALRASVPIGPHDLAPSFEDGGLHGVGLERFEARVAERLEAQGTFSEVVRRLADLRAPTVFTVAGLGLDDELPRERVLRILETLAEPPFGWTARLAPGEFALRHAVPEGLAHLERYAGSLRERLPDRRRSRVRGVAEEGPELIDAAALAGAAASDAEPDEG